MDHATLRAAVTDYFRTQLHEAKARRATLGPYSAEERKQVGNTVSLLEADSGDYWRLFGRDYAEEELNKFFDATGLSREEYWPHALRVLDEIRKAKVGAGLEIMAFAEELDEYEFSGAQNAAESATGAGSGACSIGSPERSHWAAQAVSGPLLSVLFAQRKAEAEKSGEWSLKLQDDYQSWMELFIELIGDRPILEYKKPDARKFKDILMQLPSNRGKHSQTRGLSPLEAIEAAKRNSLATLSPSTVNKGLGRMQATWNWADKQLDEEVPDIFGPMKLARNGNARTEADPFSKTQLQAIFSSPLYTGCKSERFRAERGNTDMSGTSWYWLPLLGLWTGARLNELCQLRVDDVGEELTVDDVGEEDGIPFLRFHEGDETQRIKGHKKRDVPIHPELVRLGFLRYVDAQRLSGEVRVFPALAVGPSGYYSDRPSKDFSAYIKKVGVKTEKTSFHSFRHNFKDACRHAGVNADINDILLGHALPGMAGRYGEGGAPLDVLHEAISKVEYRSLSLQHIGGYYPVECGL
ncbi:MAG: site-specific integrase [Roseovarius sp.]